MGKHRSGFATPFGSMPHWLKGSTWLGFFGEIWALHCWGLLGRSRVGQRLWETGAWWELGHQ